jgi:toxin-antitoxin system PIN domain toxin
VIVLDVNVVLAAHRDAHPHHLVARGWLEEVLASGESFGVPSSVWASFLRLATNRKVFSPPTSLADGFAFVRQVQAQQGYVAVEPGTRHRVIFERICTESGALGDLLPDAYLAAIAIENGAELASFDRDFARIPGLRWTVPELRA